MLHALIPENVLDHMSSSDEDLWADIHHTTIMFCSFTFDVNTKVDHLHVLGEQESRELRAGEEFDEMGEGDLGHIENREDDG